MKFDSERPFALNYGYVALLKLRRLVWSYHQNDRINGGICREKREKQLLINEQLLCASSPAPGP